MRKLILIVVSIFLVSSLFAQDLNKKKNVMNMYGGISVGGGSTRYAADDPNETIDSVRIIGGAIYFFSGGDTLYYYTPEANQLDAAEYFVKRLQDTVQVTAATYTLLATDASKIIRFENATYTEVTVPANTMTAGDIVTFVRTATAGPIRVNGSANVFRFSVLDSCTMNTAKQWYQIVFRTANKFELPGNYVD